MADLVDVTLECFTVCTCVQGYQELTDTVLEHSSYITPEVSEALLATMSPFDNLRATWTAPFQVASPVRLKAPYSSPPALLRFRANPQISCRITNTVAWGLRSAYLWETLRNGLEADGSRCFDKEVAKKMAEDAQRHESFLFVRCIGLYILHADICITPRIHLANDSGFHIWTSDKNRFEWASADSEGTSFPQSKKRKKRPLSWVCLIPICFFFFFRSGQR
jgi:hypothetical protein